MREIKFRGKRVDNGEWVYGSLLISEHQEKNLEPLHYFICPLDKGYHRVIPDTVGQFTGLHDKNGKEICEGDIVTYPDGDGGYEYCDEIINSGVVTWSNISLCYFATNNNTAEFPATWEYIEEIQVIGNIHDNPELLDG